MVLRRWTRRRRPRHEVVLPPVTADVSAADRETLEAMSDYTMTTVERQVALLEAVDWVVAADVPGAFVECGVWRGGSVLGMALRIQQLDARPRDLYLYDTFEGMTEPTGADVSDYHRPAREEWESTDGAPYEHMFNPDRFSEEMVRDLLLDTGYPPEHLHIVVGPVEETIPGQAPDRVALLRLDTDWYESTRHELLHLYPRVPTSGVVIVDDYGHWQGCRRAVDEHIAASGEARPLMHRVDYACRLWVRPPSQTTTVTP